MGASTNEASSEGDASGRIFVSYSREERSWAMNVVTLLEEAGFDVWWDGMLEGGENYLPTTEAALEGADCVVVLWSNISTESHWVRDEAQSGRDRQCLVPISIDGSLPPLGFRQFQTIDASKWSGKPGTTEADQILAAAQRQCGGASAPRSSTPVPSRSFAISRRHLATGAAAAVGVAALGAVGFNLLRGSGEDSISLAVTPFANLSEDPEQEWFSGGLSNELRAALARNPRLRVSAPTSSEVASDEGGDELALGRRLGVENLLRGSVQMAGGVVRVSAELLQVGDGVIVWAESFDRQFDDVLAIQSEIASTVAQALVAKIAGEDEIEASLAAQEGVGGTENVAAYEAYLRGRALFELATGLESERAALEQFEIALAADPRFALAHAWRSSVLAGLATKANTAREARRLFDSSIASAQQAIDLAPNLAAAHLAKGFALMNGRLDLKAAQPHYERARELAPGDADAQRSIALFLAYAARKEAAQESIEKVISLDPLNGRAFRTASYVALMGRRYDDVISTARSALEFNAELTAVNFAMGCAQYLLGSTGAALESFRKESIPLFSLTGQAIAQRKLGDDQGAEEAMNRIIAEYADAALYQQAQVLAQWGNLGEAIATLERAFAASDSGLLFLPSDAMLDPVRDTPEFAQFRSRLAG